ncbi:MULTISPECIES: hypothetical protein [unclassified Streptomyces]|uniref:hypothetical protein n=1 Tax=unclassified Streptomyces TaxID=2593676 RepID=UPI00371DE315
MTQRSKSPCAAAAPCSRSGIAGGGDFPGGASRVRAADADRLVAVEQGGDLLGGAVEEE